MALINCHECGEGVSTDAENCPKCGAEWGWYFRNRQRFSELCLVGFLGFLLGFLASAILLLGVLGLHT